MRIGKWSPFRSERGARWFFQGGLPLAVAIAASWFGCDAVLDLPVFFGWQEYETGRAIATKAPLDQHPGVVVIEITDRTQDELKLNRGGAVPRRYHADLIERVAKKGAEVLAFDIVFVEPEPVDELIRRAISRNPGLKVVFGRADDEAARVEDDQEPDGMKVFFYPNAIYPAGVQPGNVSDGSTLYVPPNEFQGTVLLRTDYTTGNQMNSLALAALMASMDLPPAAAKGNGLTQILMGSERVYTLPYHVFIWRKVVDGPLRVEYLDVLAGKADLRDKIVIVGDARAEKDPVAFLDGTSGPGVIAHAEMLTALIARGSLPFEASLLVEGAAGFIGALLAMLGFARGNARWAFFGVVAGASLAYGVPVAASRSPDMMCTPVGPLASVMLACLAGAALALVGWPPVQLRTSREQREGTALFIDLQDSTPITRLLGATRFSELHEDLNRALVKAVEDHGGEVERTLGDGVFALFWSSRGAHHAERCLSACLQVQRELPALSRRYPEVTQGIVVTAGLESGFVSGGYVIERGQRVWSSAGATINLAQRLQGACGGKGIVIAIGPRAAAWLSEKHPLEEAGDFVPKGFTEVVRITTLAPSER